ncbi:MAG TPA: DUF2793 domain-containing protein [Gemmatimonadales bacterium]
MPGSNQPNLGLRAGWTDGDNDWGAADSGGGMNANLRRLDALVMSAVEDKDLTAPPGSPVDGARYIVKATATGAWATHEKAIAVWNGVSSAWDFYAPKEGWITWVKDEDVMYVYNGTSWGAL